MSTRPRNHLVRSCQVPSYLENFQHHKKSSGVKLSIFMASAGCSLGCHHTVLSISLFPSHWGCSQGYSRGFTHTHVSSLSFLSSLWRTFRSEDEWWRAEGRRVRLSRHMGFQCLLLLLLSSLLLLIIIIISLLFLLYYYSSYLGDFIFLAYLQGHVLLNTQNKRPAQRLKTSMTM